MADKLVILVHGVNNKPKVMLSAKNYFESHGYTCINWLLSGHKKRFPKISLQHQQWRDDIKEVYDLAQEKNPEELIFVGFSLGALSGLVASQHYGLKWDKVLFLAPAVALRKRIQIFTPIYFLQGVPIPSIAPPGILKYTVLMSGYVRSIQLLIKKINEQKISKKMVVAMSKKDEVLNWKAVQAQAENWAENVTFITVNKKKTSRRDYHHLIAGPAYMKEETFADIFRQLCS